MKTQDGEGIEIERAAGLEGSFWTGDGGVGRDGAGRGGSIVLGRLRDLQLRMHQGCTLRPYADSGVGLIGHALKVGGREMDGAFR